MAYDKKGSKGGYSSRPQRVPAKLPLYAGVSNPPSPLRGGGNAGLWYDKFCDTWFDDYTGFDKQAWIRTLSRTAVGDPRLLAEHAGRRQQLAKACGGVVMHWTTESRMLAGLGRAHPLENGFTWHHLLGVPYLPGASIKGALRSWVAVWGGLDDPPLRREIFGSDTEMADVARECGGVAFLDALPISPVMLQGEVFTSHAGKNALLPPGDWQSPNPVPLLSTAAGQVFQFCLLPRTPEAVGVLPMVRALLAEALQLIGVGAKTASGYGRFTPDTGARVLGQARSGYSAAPSK